MATTSLSMMSLGPKLSKRTGLHFKHRSKRSHSLTLLLSNMISTLVLLFNVMNVTNGDCCFLSESLQFMTFRTSWMSWTRTAIFRHFYTCRAKLEGLQLPQHLKCAEIRTHHVQWSYWEALLHSLSQWCAVLLWKHREHSWFWRINLPTLQWLLK